MSKHWTPLESNPDVLLDYASKLGLSGAGFFDVYGLDEELLAMVPKHVLGVVFCYPITPDTEAEAKHEDEEQQKQNIDTSGVYFMKQTIGNACGTIAVLHSICNNVDRISLETSSFLDRFYDATKSLDPVSRGKYLENPAEGGPNIEENHQAAASVGDSSVPSSEEDVNLHFVAFVERGGRLWQLDGRRPAPVCHGETSREALLKDAVEVVRGFVEKSSSITFNLIAFSTGEELPV